MLEDSSMSFAFASGGFRETRRQKEEEVGWKVLAVLGGKRWPRRYGVYRPMCVSSVHGKCLGRRQRGCC